MTADEVRDTAEITRQAVLTGPGTHLACQARQSRPGSTHRYSVQRVVPATHVSTPLQEHHCPTTVDEVHHGSQRSGVVSTRGLVHQSLVSLAPAYLADDCRLLSDVGRRPLRSNSNDMRNCLCHEHITNSVIGVSRPLVLDYGTTFHLDSGGRDLPLTLLDNL